MAHAIESLIAMIPEILPGDKAKRGDTIQLNVADGRLDPQQAFMQGKAKV